MRYTKCYYKVRVEKIWQQKRVVETFLVRYIFLFLFPLFCVCFLYFAHEINKKQQKKIQQKHEYKSLYNFVFTRTVKKMIKDFLFSTKNSKEGYNKV